MDLTGRTVLVAGGTRGIGLALALRLLAAGNEVVVSGRRADVLDRLAREHPGLGTVVIDVTDDGSVADGVADVAARHPGLDVLMTVSGIMEPEDLRDPGSWDVAGRTVATNLLGTMRLVRAALPQLLGRPRAAVVTVSSGLAFVPRPDTPTYNATKAAVHSFTESLRVQLAGTPVQVWELVPPAVRTTLMGQQGSSHAMDLDAYVDEALGLLGAAETPGEVLVQRVLGLRWAERDGTYGERLAMLSGLSVLPGLSTLPGA